MISGRHPRAFTVSELLIVIVIIGLLVALLLPAIQAAREASRRMQCSSHLRQIGIALHNYEISIKSFPPGAVFYGGPNVTHGLSSGPMYQRGSILVFILPFIEQTNVYSFFDFAEPTDNARFPPNVNRGMYLRGYTIPIYLCPSDLNRPLNAGANQVQPANYYPCMGPTASISDNPNCSCPLWPTFRTYSQLGTDNNNPAGLFTRNGWDYVARIADCTDGLSNTILFGEVRADSSAHVRVGWSHSNKWGAFTQIPINFDTSEETVSQAARKGLSPCNVISNWNAELGYKSRHVGGAQVVMGDCSIKFLSQNIDMLNYQNLGAKADNTEAILTN